LKLRGEVALAVALLTIACAGATHDPASRTAACTVVRDGNAAAEDSATADSACVSDSTRYALLTGRPAAAGSVFVGAYTGFHTDVHDSHWTFRWPARARLLRVAGLLGYSRSAPSPSESDADRYVSDAEHSMLPHEIGHGLDEARWGDAVFHVPAWYEEATAMWMEPSASRLHRLQQAQDGAATAPPLDSVFLFERPAVDPMGSNFSRADWDTIVAGSCRGKCGPPPWTKRLITWRVGGDGKATSDTLYDDAVKASMTHADSVARYYTYSIAALYYVRARGGLAALHALATRIGPETGATDPLAGLPGIPPAGTAREADWRGWLRSAGTAQP